MKGALETVEICVLCVVGDSQTSLQWCQRHLLATIQFAVSYSDLYFAHFFALKWIGTFTSEGKAKLCVYFNVMF